MFIEWQARETDEQRFHPPASFIVKLATEWPTTSGTALHSIEHYDLSHACNSQHCSFIYHTLLLLLLLLSRFMHFLSLSLCVCDNGVDSIQFWRPHYEMNSLLLYGRAVNGMAVNV
jgi:hypothetical protein